MTRLSLFVYLTLAFVGCSSETPCVKRVDCGSNEFCDYSFARCTELRTFARLSAGICKAKPRALVACTSNEDCDPYDQGCEGHVCVEIGEGNVEPSCPSSCVVDTPPFLGRGTPACVCDLCPDGSEGTPVHTQD